MNNREIKFRVWNPTYGMMKPLDIWAMTSFQYDNGDGSKTLEKSYPSESIFMQFTGLKDKNGREVYEGDLLLIRFITKYYDLEAIYEMQSRGFTTSFFMRKLIKPDEVVSDIRLEAVEDFEWWAGERLEITYGPHDERQRSTDIEVIGNIWETPELINE